MSSNTSSAPALLVVDKAGTLSPLEGEIHRGLTAIAVAGFMSIWGTLLLFGYICWRLATWKRSGFCQVNQYVVVLLNLVVADLIQAIGFSLSLHWLIDDSITADTPACHVQGWFINAGDVGACFFTLTMAVLLFCDIVLERRIKRPWIFAVLVTGIWILDVFLASIGVALYRGDFYRRAGLWCWINEKYMDERLVLHYLWVLLAEFGTVVLYSVMFMTIWRRTRELMWEGDDVRLRRRAQSAAWTVIAYPIVYVVCTLPAVVARLSLMAHTRKVGNVELSVVGFMLVSNGWLDVILYSTTRRSLITGQTMHNQEAHALDTFVMCRGQANDFTTSWRGGNSVKEITKEVEIVQSEELSPEASPSNSWDRDTASPSERRTRDFTNELDAIRRPQRIGSDVRAQSLNWENLERVHTQHGHSRSVVGVGVAK